MREEIMKLSILAITLCLCLASVGCKKRDNPPEVGNAFKAGEIVFEKLSGEKAMIVHVPDCCTDVYTVKVQVGGVVREDSCKEFELTREIPATPVQ
jgi:hypothetical protein